MRPWAPTTARCISAAWLDDCSRVFTTSSGHVTSAPSMPPNPPAMKCTTLCAFFFAGAVGAVVVGAGGGAGAALCAMLVCRSGGLIAQGRRGAQAVDSYATPRSRPDGAIAAQATRTGRAEAGRRGRGTAGGDARGGGEADAGTATGRSTAATRREKRHTNGQKARVRRRHAPRGLISSQRHRERDRERERELRCEKEKEGHRTDRGRAGQ